MISCRHAADGGGHGIENFWICLRPLLYINARFLTQSVTGVQRYAHALLDAFDELVCQEPDLQDLKVVLLAPKRGVIHEKRYRRLELRQVGMLRGHAWEQFELPLHARGGVLFCPGNTAPVSALLGRRPTVVTVHSIAFLEFPEAYSKAFRLLYRLLVPIVLRLSTAAITVTETERKTILARYPFAARRLTVVQNGGLPGDPVFEKPAGDGEREIPFALFIGSLNRLKNIQGVVAAARILRRRPIRFVIVGGTARSFRDAALGGEAADLTSIEFLGQVDDPERLIEIYRSAFCLVYPSFYESSGLPPLEAMACRCPVIASEIPVLVERCGDAALFCDPKDPTDIANKIEQLLGNPDLRSALVEKGVARAREFTWKNCAMQTLAILGQVVEKQGPVGQS